MGALASHAQQADVAERVALLAQGAELVFGAATASRRMGEGVAERRLLRADAAAVPRRIASNDAVHDVEAFGPVSTLMPYDDLDEALALAARGKRQPGRHAGHAATRRSRRKVIPQIAAWHGRLLILDREAAVESTGHGSPLPLLKHGGPGRAGGGEELGGMRAVKHYLQRAAVQGSPTMLAAVTGEYVRGAKLQRERACTRSASTSRSCRSATRC